MSQVILRSSRIENHRGDVENNGQYTAVATVRVAWGDVPLFEEMGWNLDPKGHGNGNMIGKMNGVSVIMEPNNKQLKDYRFDISITKASGFKHVAKMKSGKHVGSELEFTITSVDDAATISFMNYMKHCNPGDDRGQCRITFNAEEQMKLDDAPKAGKEAPEASKKTRGRKK